MQNSGQTPKREVTGIEAKLLGPSPDQASADNPVTLVFMGYKTVEEEQETRTALGMEGVDGNVKAEFVVIEDGEGKDGGEAATADQAPPNGSMAEKEKANGGGEEGEKEKEKKQTCKCCTVMWGACARVRTGEEENTPNPRTVSMRATTSSSYKNHRLISTLCSVNSLWHVFDLWFLSIFFYFSVLAFISYSVCISLLWDCVL